MSNEIETYAEDIGETTEVSWRGPENMTYEKWAAIGRTLQLVNRSVGWWIGDWLAFGERKYGESYTQAVDATDLSVETLKKYLAVCKRIAPEERQANLSWSHHFAVAYLPEEERGPMLELAARFELSTRTLKTLCGLDAQARQHILTTVEGWSHNDARMLMRLLTDVRLKNTDGVHGVHGEDGRGEEEAVHEDENDIPFTDDRRLDLELDVVHDFWVKAGFPVKRTARDRAIWPGIVVRADVDGMGNPILVWEIDVHG